LRFFSRQRLRVLNPICDAGTVLIASKAHTDHLVLPRPRQKHPRPKPLRRIVAPAEPQSIHRTNVRGLLCRSRFAINASDDASPPGDQRHTGLRPNAPLPNGFSMSVRPVARSWLCPACLPTSVLKTRDLHAYGARL